ncbi:MAG: FMN-binding protein [Treponemataceae bacterium]
MKKALLLALVTLVTFAVFAVDGEFTGSGKGGKNGSVTVKITVLDSKITDIVVVESKEDRAYAFDQIKEAILAENNTNVDVVSGATMSSKAYVAAVESATKAAKLKLKGKKIPPAPKKDGEEATAEAAE